MTYGTCAKLDARIGHEIMSNLTCLGFIMFESLFKVNQGHITENL